MTHVERLIDLEARIEAAEPVLVRGERQVVPCVERLELRPRRPAEREAALLARRLQACRIGRHGRPRRRRPIGIEAGLLERVLVDVEHRRRAVERQRQHLPLRRRVITGHRGHVRLRIELLARLGHQLVDRLDRALRVHHRRRAHLEHLHDRRRVLRAVGGDRRGHRLGIRALEDRHDLVVGLFLVEAIGEAVDAIAERTRHRMPPLDFGDGLRGRCASAKRKGDYEAREAPDGVGHELSSWFVRTVRRHGARRGGWDSISLRRARRAPGQPPPTRARPARRGAPCGRRGACRRWGPRRASAGFRTTCRPR